MKLNMRIKRLQARNFPSCSYAVLVVIVSWVSSRTGVTLDHPMTLMKILLSYGQYMSKVIATVKVGAERQIVVPTVPSLP